MEVKVTNVSDTKVKINLKLDEKTISEAKKSVLQELKKDVSAPGFRKGQAPLNIVEKQTDDDYLKNQVLDRALNLGYQEAISSKKIAPLAAPNVNIKKFVPFSEIEAELEVETTPEIKLPKLSTIKAEKPKATVKQKEVDEVIENLRKRLAEKSEVKRAVKKDDEVVIDFDGTDKDGKPVAGAKGKDYPLVIGSDTFIPGFEDEIIGMKPGDSKTFEITFPEDYAHKPLAKKKVDFKVELKSVKEVKLPEVNGEFVKKVGPFKKLEELKDDIKSQLANQKEQEVNNIFADNIISEIAKKADIPVPEVLLNEQVEAMEMDLKQNLVYRGITIDEFLKQEGMTNEEYKDEKLKPQAEKRVKAGLILSQVAKDNDLDVNDQEIDIRLQLMKGQYASDNTMQQQLDTEAARRDVASRLLSEKAVEVLRQKVSKK